VICYKYPVGIRMDNCQKDISEIVCLSCGRAVKYELFPSS
ncbi:hypothetical protein CBR_g87006, partial [Chara braunii]